jgi:hypothetical protein
VIAQGLKYLVRGFRAGREMEDVIDRAMDAAASQAAQQPQQGPPQPDPVEQAKAKPPRPMARRPDQGAGR